MSYYARYGLEYDPFIKNDKKDKLIETIEYNECKTRLDHLLKLRGFGLVTGAAGLGKTTSIRHWSKGLDRNKYDIIYISLSTITVDQFYYQLAEALGLEPHPRKTRNYKNIQELIKNISIERRKIPVIILDEAHYMASKILSDLKMLFNFEMDSQDHAVILLVGLPLINNTLKLKSNEPLKQRIIMSYQLNPLSKEQAKIYIQKKTSGAGAMHDVFSENILESIVSSANGTLRIINNICSKALFIGGKLEIDHIDADVIMAAIDEVEI